MKWLGDGERRARLRTVVARRVTRTAERSKALVGEGLVLVLVGLELLLAFLARVPWMETATTLDDLVLVPTGLKLLSYVSPTAKFVSDGLLLVIYAAGFYRMMSSAVFGRVLPDDLSADSLPLLMTGIAVAVTAWGVWFTGRSPTNTRAVLSSGGLVIAAGASVLAVYLSRPTRRRLAVFFYDLLDQQWEPNSSTRAPRVLTTFAVPFTASVLAFFCFAVGSLTAVVSMFELLPDLLLVVALVRWGNVLEVEELFHEGMAVVVRSPKGIPAVTLVVSGLVLSVLPFLDGLVQLREDLGWLYRTRANVPRWLLDPFATDLTLRNSLRVWNSFGGVTDLLAGFLLLWFWVAIARRLPAFVTAWSGTFGNQSERPAFRADQNTSVRAARPTVLFLLANILWFGNRAFRVLALRIQDDLWLGYALFWPWLCLFGVRSFVRSRHDAPQRVETDQYAIPLAFALQIVFVVLMLRGFFLLLVFERHSFVALGVVALGTYFWPEMRAFGRVSVADGYLTSAWAGFLGLSLVGVAYVLLPGNPPLAVGLRVLLAWLPPTTLPTVATVISYGALLTLALAVVDPVVRRRFGVSTTPFVLPNVATFLLLSFLGPVLNFVINIALP